MRNGISRNILGRRGFTLMELLVAVAVMGIISAVAVPALSAYYGKCCAEAALLEIAGMIKEAKQNALDGSDYAISFDADTGKISLLSGYGPDREWNTTDDPVVRTFRLADKGGSLSFGHGNYGPVEGLASHPDGIAFHGIHAYHTLVCDPKLSGNPGTVYVRSSSGAAVALSMNRTDFGYKLYRWSGKRWVRY